MILKQSSNTLSWLVQLITTETSHPWGSACHFGDKRTHPLRLSGLILRNYLFTYGCAVETCQVKVGGKGNVPWYFHYPLGSAPLQIIPCVRTSVCNVCVPERGLVRVSQQKSKLLFVVVVFGQDCLFPRGCLV